MYPMVNGFENDKVVLRAFQLLEELTCLIKENDLQTPPSIRIQDVQTVTLRNALMLHTKLKRLLCQRYYLHLRVEYTRACWGDDSLFNQCCNAIKSEKRKHNELPKFGYNHLPEKYVIDVVSLNMLSEKLYSSSYKWRAIDVNFQNNVCLTDPLSNCRFIHMLCHSDDMQRLFHHPLFFSVMNYLTIYLKRFCYFDPANVSPTLISNISHSCNILNKFLIEENKFKFNRQCCTNTLNLRYHQKSKNEVDWKIIFSFLSKFEASLAAVKIVSALMTAANRVMKEANKQYKINWIPIEVTGNKSINADTSDYLSASLSETDMFCESFIKRSKSQDKTLANVDKNVTSVFESILIRNQTLLLKYLIIDINKETSNQRKPENNYKKCVAGTCVLECLKNWKKQIPLVLDSSDDEKKYWRKFWCKTDECILKLLVDIPTHNHSDKLPGTISVWPEDFAAVLMKILKTTSESEDISVEGRLCLKNMFYHVFSCISSMTWDKSFCIVLSATSKTYCSSVPMENEQFGTKPGYLFYTALKPLLAIFFSGKLCSELQVFENIRGLISTLNCFQNWVITKQKTLLSSLDFSTCFIIAYCDVQHIKGLIKPIANTNFAINAEEKLSSSSARLFTWRCFTEKLNEIMDLNKDFPVMVCRRIESLTFSRLKLCQRNLCQCRRTEIPSNDGVECFEEMLELALKPIYESTSLLQRSGYENWNAFEESVLAVGQVYLKFLNFQQTRCVRINSRQFNIICNEMTQLREWLESLHLLQPDNFTLSSRSKEKITAMLKSLDAAKQYQRRRRCICTNKVTPL